MAVNLAGENVILGAEYVQDREVFIAKTEDTYKLTPVFNADEIPQGRYGHIGSGVWLKRCSCCPDYVLTYGTVAFNHVIAKHEANHNLVVPGWNAPLLP